MIVIHKVSNRGVIAGCKRTRRGGREGGRVVEVALSGEEEGKQVPSLKLIKIAVARKAGQKEGRVDRREGSTLEYLEQQGVQEGEGGTSHQRSC